MRLLGCSHDEEEFPESLRGFVSTTAKEENSSMAVDFRLRVVDGVVESMKRALLLLTVNIVAVSCYSSWQLNSMQEVRITWINPRGFNLCGQWSIEIDRFELTLTSPFF